MVRANNNTSERHYRRSYIFSAVFQHVKANSDYLKTKLTAKYLTSRIFLSNIVPLAQ